MKKWSLACKVFKLFTSNGKKCTQPVKEQGFRVQPLLVLKICFSRIHLQLPRIQAPNHWWLERCICKASLLLIQIPFFPGHHILSKPFTFPIQYLLRRTAVTEFCWYRNPHRSGSSPEIVLHQVHTTEADDFPDWLVQQSFKLNLATVISTLIFLPQVLDISKGCQELGKSR